MNDHHHRDLTAHLVLTRRSGFHLDAVFGMVPGETVALLGPNGAGKTTVVSALAGILPLDAGHIRLGDTVLDDPVAGVFRPPETRNFGVVFQDHMLFPHLNVVDNVAFGLRARGMSARAARRAATRWLDEFDLGAFSHLKPDRLSGGQAQQIALARTLAATPDLLLLDEPLAALDITTRTQLRRSLSTHLADFPGPRLVITHDPTEAFLLADRVVILENGATVQSGTPDQIRRHPATSYVADLVGVNLVTGQAVAGTVTTADGHRVFTADTALAGGVLLNIHPRSISLHPSRPGGSPRNTWQTVITAVEPLGDRTRFETGPPLPLTAELTAAAHRDLQLEPGRSVWVAIKATEIVTHPA